MVVMVREHKTSAGKMYFTLEEPESGIRRIWNPPKNLKRSDYDNVLILLAKLLEEQVIQMREGIETPAQDSLFAPTYPKEITLHDAGVEFMRRKSVELAEYTRSGWQSCLDSRIYPYLGDMPIRNIKPHHITDFLLSLKAEGLANGTVQKYHLVLLHLFRCAKSLEMVDDDIMLQVDKPKPRKDEPIREQVDACSANEVRYILECADKEPLKWRTLMWLISDTGIRRGECVGIDWDSVDFASCQIAINKNVGYTHEKGIYVTTTKSRKNRIVDVDPEVMFLLLQMYTKSNSRWVFANRDDPKLPMNPQSPTGYFSKFSRKYGVIVHPHKLRHSFASISILNGADIASISAILGHHDASFTLRTYTHSNSESRKKASDICRQAIRAASANPIG